MEDGDDRRRFDSGGGIRQIARTFFLNHQSGEVLFMIHHSDYRRDITNAEAAIVGAVLAFGAVALMFYLAVARFHLRKEQLLEGGFYLVVIVAAVLAPTLRKY